MASIFGSQTEILKSQSFNVNKSPKNSSSMMANPRSRADIALRDSSNFKREKAFPYSSEKIEFSLSKDLTSRIHGNKSINSKKPAIKVKDSSLDMTSQRNSSKEACRKVSSLLKAASSQNNFETKEISKLLYKSSNELVLPDRLSRETKALPSAPISTFAKLLNSKGEDKPQRNETNRRQSPQIAKIGGPMHNTTSLSDMNNSRQICSRNSQSRLNSLSQNKPKHLSKTSENIAHQQQTVSSLTRIPRAKPLKPSSTSHFYEKPGVKTSKNACLPKCQILTEAQLSLVPSLTFGNINLFSKSYENKNDELWPLSERGELATNIEAESHSNQKFFSRVRHLMALSLKTKLPN